jgi:hypothetical protein
VQFFWIDSNGLVFSIGDHADFQLRHLADFFLQGHLPEQFFHRGSGSACRWTCGSHIAPQECLAINDPGGSVISAGGSRHNYANSQ